MPTDIPQWPKVDRRLFESEILPAGKPVALQALSISVHLPHFDLQHRLDLPMPSFQSRS